MESCATVAEARARIAAARRQGNTIGLVPTMGALHAGHAALIEHARAGADYLAVSIFVNPLQFERRDDFEAYVLNLPEDLEFCRARGADLVFVPTAEEMYPSPQQTFVEVAGLSEVLCGKFRPGHFRGVATVVAKLFHIVQPDRAWFGEKDYQQLTIIRKMVLDLTIPVEIVSVATVREPDGLALSWRNRRLGADHRQAATVLYRALRAAREIIDGGGSAAQARQAGLDVLAHEPRVRVEYFEVVDAQSLVAVEQIAGPARIAVAAWVGGTRLIDNA